ncbi:MAG: signal peptidase I [Solirubrobacteraceae bacterium]|nr:signal peptidase I [Solirubrobacteraceae bacterium]
MARRKDVREEEEHSWLETVLVVIGALVLALGIQQFLVKPYKIPSPSMVPTLAEGQRILVNRVANNFGDPQNGQIVVFNPPAGAGDTVAETCGSPHDEDEVCLDPVEGKLDQAYVKRVVGEPGDKVRVENGNVIRNGKPVDEPYAQTCDDQTCNLKEFTVPAGHYFMMGDNRGNSEDSRFWGPLPREYVIGRAFATYWPPKRIGGL